MVVPVHRFAFPSRRPRSLFLFDGDNVRDGVLVRVGRGEGEHLGALFVLGAVGVRGPRQACPPPLAVVGKSYF